MSDLSAVLAPSRAAEQSAQSAVWRGAWSALWRSRVLVWASGCVAFALIGVPAGKTGALAPGEGPFAKLGALLGAPAVRWDGTWLVSIAQHGYSSLAATRFFPLYPLLIHLLSPLTVLPAIAGVAISLGAMLAALVLIHRLTALELGERSASLTTTLVAFGPLSLYLSAVYSEGLLLALSAGTLYSARRGRWALAGVLGALAALTRVTGFLLVVPLLVMYLYGPRDEEPAGPARSRWLPRYAPRPSLLWAGLVPCGTGLYALYLRLDGYGALSFLHAQTRLLHHVLTAPPVTVWRAALSAWQQLHLGLTGWGSLLSVHQQSVVGLLALLAAALALGVVVRRLPLCYGAWVGAGMLVPLCSPVAGNPMAGVARYLSVLFPLYMGGAAWGLERGVSRRLVVGAALLLMFFTAQFATWHVVGSQEL
jgi:hypothetical protein